jgi:hypothetical protein
MSDIFGYNRTARSTGQIASSEFAVVTIGGIQSLVQNTQVNYGQDIRTIFEIGNPNIYWVPGHASGTVDCTSLVGPGGFFAGWKGGKCGAISPISISTSGGTCYTGNASLYFDGGIIARVSATLTAGTMEISQSVSVQVATMMA